MTRWAFDGSRGVPLWARAIQWGVAFLLVCAATTSLAQELPAVPWHLDRIDQRTPLLDGKTMTGGVGHGVTIYVLDTGVRLTHDAFEGRASAASIGHQGDLVGDSVGRVHGAGGDCQGHGTHMAALAAGYRFGVAPAASIQVIRVVDCHGYGDPDALVRALTFLAEHGERPGVVLMSLEYPKNPKIDQALAAVLERGLVLVAGAGGGMADACDISPAGARGVITVAPVSTKDIPLPFSNTGPCVDLYAPGERILSAATENDTAATAKSGSSQAAAIVAGAVALLLERDPNLSPWGIRAHLIELSTKDAVPLTRRGRETGTPSRLLYVGE